MRLLVDLGGTSCRVGLATGAGLLPDTAHSFANADHTSLADLLAAYLHAMRPGAVSAICAGVAGPVRRGAAQLTNHAWHIEADALARATGADQVHLMNDLQAQAYALDDLDADSLTPLIPGTPDPEGPRMVLGLGTGCNIAVAHRVGDDLFVPPSESGHTTLPDAPGFRALYDHLRGEASHLPIETALSGPRPQPPARLLYGRDTDPDRDHRAGAPQDPASLRLTAGARRLEPVPVAHGHRGALPHWRHRPGRRAVSCAAGIHRHVPSARTLHRYPARHSRDPHRRRQRRPARLRPIPRKIPLGIRPDPTSPTACPLPYCAPTHKTKSSAHGRRPSLTD